MYDEKQPGADKDRWLQFDDDDSDGRKRSRDDSNSTRTHGRHHEVDEHGNGLDT